MDDLYNTLGAIYIFRHERDSALAYLTPERMNSMSVRGRMNYYHQLYKMEQALGNTTMQVRWADSLLSCRQQIEEQDNSSAIRNLVHQRQLGLVEQQYQQKLTMTYLWVITALVIILFVIVARYALTWKERRNLQRKEDLRTKMLLLLMQNEQEEESQEEEETAEFDEEMHQNDSSDTKASSTAPQQEATTELSAIRPANGAVQRGEAPTAHLMTQLRREQLKQCRTLFERSDSARIMQRLRMSAMPKLNEAQRQDLQQEILLCFGDVCQSLLLEYAPRLKANDALMCLALYLGCDHRQCAVLMGTTENGVRSRKKRVKQTLSPEDFDLFCRDRI